MSLISHQPSALRKDRPKHGEALNRIQRAQVRIGWAQGRSQISMQRAYGCSYTTITRAINNLRKIKDNTAEDEAYLDGTKTLEDYEAELGWTADAPALDVLVDKPRRSQHYEAELGWTADAPALDVLVDKPRRSQRHGRKLRQGPYPTPPSTGGRSRSQSKTARSPAPVRWIIDEEVPQFLQRLGLTMRSHIRTMSALGIRTADDLAALKSTRDSTLDVMLRRDAAPKGFKWNEWVKIIDALKA